MKIDYNDFVDMAVSALPDYMPQEFHGTIEPKQVEKLQGESYYGIAITPDDNRVGISMDLHSSYNEWEHGRSLHFVLKDLSENAVASLQNAPVQMTENLLDYDQMKEKLFVQVIPTESNAEMLSNVPHQNIEDMSMVYRFMLESDEGQTASVLITNSLLDTYGITADQLHEDAMESAPVSFPAKVQSMEAVLSEMLGISVDELPDHEDNGMYVATCNGGTLGAGCIAYPDFMENAAEQLEGDFFLIPSSIHEVLLLPDHGEHSVTDLQKMVRDVNASEVLPADRLSDHVYHYDAKEHVFEKAENYQARKLSREKAQTPEKESVLKKLKEKSSEVNLQDAVASTHKRDKGLSI